MALDRSMADCRRTGHEGERPPRKRTDLCR